MTGARVLIVDDDRFMLKTTSEALKSLGYEVVVAENGHEGLQFAQDPFIAVALIDVVMPGMSGLDVLKSLKEARPDMVVIMMSAEATIATAVEAVKLGAYDYLAKPFSALDALDLKVKNALERGSLVRRTEVLEKALETTGRLSFEQFVGESPQMQAVYRLITQIAPAPSTVLIQGESGTGKELVARSLHERSPRKNKPFVTVNCSAMTETLLESELFGYVKGAFTGATGNRRGLFEAAHGGTLFLDEIGDISPGLQSSLLRVLQSGEVRRVGSNETLHSDVRLVAATNVDLPSAVKRGRFREDLFYRLSVVTVTLPPLRDRPQDIPALANFFLKRFSTQFGKSPRTFSRAAMEVLTVAHWQGNVRELEHAVERAVLLCETDSIGVSDLPPHLASAATGGAARLDSDGLSHLPYLEARQLAQRTFERRYFTSLLARHSRNVTQSARSAGMDRSNFRRILRRLDLHNHDDETTDP